MQNGSTTYTYDAENRLTALSSPAWYYVYDGDGSRVEKCTTSTCPSSGTGTVYWRNLAGDPISESGLNGTVNHEYIFFNGERAARRETSGNAVSYYFADHLGSADVVTNATGTITKESDYYPYGGEIPISGSDINNYKFTGKERDSESGLDEFGARYYASPFGRFMTPDWAAKPTAVPYASFGNPQSLNLYSYVNNNPTTIRDADGHCLEDACVAESLAVAALTAYVASPAGQQLLHNAAKDIVSAIGSLFHSSDKSTTAPPTQSNPAPGTQTGATVPATAPAVPLPAGLVGTQDDKSGSQGDRHNSGPLDPAHGGVGDAAQDFATLTGGKSGPAAAGSNYPPGTQVGENGTALRPATATAGPRIDIPANGDKSHETLHYPKPKPKPAQ